MEVKIKLEKNETVEDADEMLFKALNLHRTGEIHVNESFEDPAMMDLSQRIEKEYQDIYQDMMNEIMAILDEDYHGN